MLRKLNDIEKKKAQHAADKKRGKYANKPRQC